MLKKKKDYENADLEDCNTKEIKGYSKVGSEKNIKKKNDFYKRV